MKSWADEIWEKIEKKLDYTSSATGDSMFAYTTKDGKHTDKENVYYWTNGFWPGIMWLMYYGTGKEKYKTVAESLELKLDEALYGYEWLNHDVGFMWLPTSVANYRLTGNEASKKRGLIAASYLASRYNPAGNFIRAWNGQKNQGWAIIDCMMNIPLLYWASDVTGDPHYKHIAQNHADTVMKTFIRDDGSVNHINSYDPETGEFIESFGGQGYAEGSSWSRGQSWALYGFILSYIHTGKKEYLDTAKRVAHYFIAALCANDDYVPDCDFRSPKEPVYKDATAGTIAACGLVEIAKNVGEYEKGLYLNSALKILKAIDKSCCDWSRDNDAIIQNGTEAYDRGVNIPIIYGDYYFIEAILKLRGMDMLFW